MAAIPHMAPAMAPAKGAIEQPCVAAVIVDHGSDGPRPSARRRGGVVADQEMPGRSWELESVTDPE
jgi:hypothetical protein